MRVLIVIILSTLNIYLNAQTNNSYSIEGHINPKYKASKVYLTYSLLDSNTLYLDSCDISNGKFSFSDTLSYPIPASLSFVTSDKNVAPIGGVNFHLDPRNITIDYRNSSDDILISGSPTTDLYSEYLSLQSSLQDEGRQLQQTYQNASPQQKADKQFKDSLDRVVQGYTKPIRRNVAKFHQSTSTICAECIYAAFGNKNPPFGSEYQTDLRSIVRQYKKQYSGKSPTQHYQPQSYLTYRYQSSRLYL